MAEAARGCVCCQPLVDPEHERENTQHAAIRFGDVKARVSLDGEEIHDCIEVQAGPGGWAIRLTMPPRRCSKCGLEYEHWLDRSDGYEVKVTTHQEVG